jgi:hypothetical protein
VYAWESDLDRAKSDLFSDENVWVLLDPIEATKGGTEVIT